MMGWLDLREMIVGELGRKIPDLKNDNLAPNEIQAAGNDFNRCEIPTFDSSICWHGPKTNASRRKRENSSGKKREKEKKIVSRTSSD
jgi:hypothetical protein